MADKAGMVAMSFWAWPIEPRLASAMTASGAALLATSVPVLLARAA